MLVVVLCNLPAEQSRIKEHYCYESLPTKKKDFPGKPCKVRFIAGGIRLQGGSKIFFNDQIYQFEKIPFFYFLKLKREKR